MSRYGYWMLACVAICFSSVGCCGPRGCGIGCGIPTGCNDCDGANYGERIIPARPLDGLRQLRKSMVCGSGCGEVYVGEWTSTPPDANDPCCDGQFVGGAQKCRPFCWQPGGLLRNLYGSRFCSGEESSTPCGCGDVGCSGDCGVIDGGYVDGYVTPAAVGTSSNCGCAKATPVGVRRQVAQRMVQPRVSTAGRTAKPLATQRR